MQVSKVSAFEQNEKNNRLTTFPIEYPNLYNLYKSARRSFWTPGEINFSDDVSDFRSFSAREQLLVRKILAFFAAGDGIVNLNLIGRFSAEVPMVEAQYFYRFQAMMEDIHAEVYSQMLDSICESEAEKTELFDAVRKDPAIAKMAKYMFDAIDSEADLSERLLRFACVEGVFFSGCFFAIYWFQTRKLMKGLSHANEFIARDEAMHTSFAIELLKMTTQPISVEKCIQVISEAVSIAGDFIHSALPEDLPELNASVMNDYTKTIADIICEKVCGKKIFGINRYFHFMEQINLINRTNYFERKVSDYSRPDGEYIDKGPKREEADIEFDF